MTALALGPKSPEVEPRWRDPTFFLSCTMLEECRCAARQEGANTRVLHARGCSGGQNRTEGRPRRDWTLARGSAVISRGGSAVTLQRHHQHRRGETDNTLGRSLLEKVYIIVADEEIRRKPRKDSTCGVKGCTIEEIFHVMSICTDFDSDASAALAAEIGIGEPSRSPIPSISKNVRARPLVSIDDSTAWNKFKFGLPSALFLKSNYRLDYGAHLPAYLPSGHPGPSANKNKLTGGRLCWPIVESLQVVRRVDDLGLMSSPEGEAGDHFATTPSMIPAAVQLCPGRRAGRCAGAVALRCCTPSDGREGRKKQLTQNGLAVRASRAGFTDEEEKFEEIE
ncbi:hypothetical protein B0H13DRAFT_1916169 [Mycena leptocephala]|nr:hypothetical protein B0H13DRAFT_1916169 [Mycena leptocephala]